VLQDSRHVLKPPGRAAAGPQRAAVERGGYSPQGLPAVAQVLDFGQNSLFAGVWLDVPPIGAQAIAELDIAHPLAICALVPERIAGALPDSFPLPLRNRRHDVQHKPSGRGASIERFGNRDQGHTTPLESLQQLGSYTFAEATSGQDLRNWIGSHTRAFEFFGGTVEVVVPDNLKSAVTHPSYYEPDLNPTYRDLGEHYGVAIIPARPYRARDKAKAEVGVQVVQRWIVAALRKRKFFSLTEVNQAIAELLVRLNERPFRKRPGNRATLFAQQDRPALKPLPATRYQFGEWKTARVNIDYHMEVERHFYSVPYALVHQEMDVHLTADTVEVLHRGVRVASHVRSHEPGKATTLTEHRPKSHQKYLGQTPSRLIDDAQQVGPCTGQLVAAILAAKRHPEQGFRSCLGILRLAKTYPTERMEAAARRCLRARAYNCQSMDSILKNQLDRLPLPGEAPTQAAVEHDNIRGADYFDSPPETDPPVIP
jgi:transposase